MKQILILMGILSFFGFKKNDLSADETELIKKLDFNIELIKELKAETKSKLFQLPAIDQETADVLDKLYDGIRSKASEGKVNLIVKKLKAKFKENGYLIFVFTGEEDFKSIGVIKGTNELDILRYRRTDGVNYGHENEDIISKISEWNNQFGLTVLGCGRDWLELEFKKLPTDLEAFSHEVYEFCPDSVEQGVGEVENLEPLIIEMNGIWLWWD